MQGLLLVCIIMLTVLLISHAEYFLQPSIGDSPRCVYRSRLIAPHFPNLSLCCSCRGYTRCRLKASERRLRRQTVDAEAVAAVTRSEAAEAAAEAEAARAAAESAKETAAAAEARAAEAENAQMQMMLAASVQEQQQQQQRRQQHGGEAGGELWQYEGGDGGGSSGSAATVAALQAMAEEQAASAGRLAQEKAVLEAELKDTKRVVDDLKEQVDHCIATSEKQQQQQQRRHGDGSAEQYGWNDHQKHSSSSDSNVGELNDVLTYSRLLAEGRATEVYELQMVVTALEAEKATLVEDRARLRQGSEQLREKLQPAPDAPT